MKVVTPLQTKTDNNKILKILILRLNIIVLKLLRVAGIMKNREKVIERAQ